MSQENKDKEWIANELAESDKDGNALKVNQLDFTTWEIDFDNVNDVEDIKTILKAISFRFTNSHPGFEEFIHLLKKVNE